MAKNLKRYSGNGREDGRGKHVLSSADDAGHEDPDLNIWFYCSDGGNCPECGQGSVQKMRDVSILETFRCLAGHVWYRICV